jgi:hypothetical protein
VPTFDFKERVQGREPFTINPRDGGEEIVLPTVLPAKTLLVYMNMSSKELEGLQDASIQEKTKLGIDLIEGLMGQKDWDRIVSAFGLENINDLTLEIFEYYGLTSSEAEGEEEEEGKEEKVDQSHTSKSLSTSEPSTQTLNGSTPKQDEDSTMELLTTDSSSNESATYLPRASS